MVADTKEVDDIKQSEQTEWKGQNSNEQKKKSLEGNREGAPGKVKGDLG